MIRLDDLDEPSQAPSAEAVQAMFAVVQGMAPTDAWLGYLRARHPAAVDVLAKAAMTDLALDLLVEHHDLSTHDAVRQREEAAQTAANMLAPHEWNEIREIAVILEELGATFGEDADVVVLSERHGSSAPAR
jgi:hypothetical protein